MGGVLRFRQLRGLTGVCPGRSSAEPPRSASCRPRPHDLRHSFAVATLLDWYRDGGDVEARLPLLSTYLGHVDPTSTYWYLHAAPELLAEAAATPRRTPGRPAMSALAPTLQAFFTDRLIRARQASPHTIAAYRDTLRLLIVFAAQRLGKPPSRLDVADLDASLIAAFLDHLEHDRANSTRTRNARLAAIHSLFRFAALRHPEHAADIDRVLAIPSKRADRALVTYLTEPELDALLASPDRHTWTGRRDHALILLAAQTGLRASELTALTCADVHLRRRGARPLPGQGPQGPHHPAHRRHRRDPAGLDRRARRRPDRPAVPDPPRPTAVASTRSNAASPTTPSTPPAPARR